MLPNGTTSPILATTSARGARMTDRTTHRTTDRPTRLLVLDGDGGTSRPARRGYGHPWLTLVAVSFGLMMVGLDNTIVAVANPTIGRHFGASLGRLQWVTNSYLLAVATGLITGGKLGDRFGRK